MEQTTVEMFERRLAALIDEYGVSAFSAFAFYHDSAGALKCACSRLENPKAASVKAAALSSGVCNAGITSLQETGAVTSIKVEHDRITVVSPIKGENAERKAPLTDTELFDTEFDITLDVLSATSVVAAIQLASRHPKWNGPSRGVAIAFAQELQEKVAEVAPSMDVILSMGWYRSCF